LEVKLRKVLLLLLLATLPAAAQDGVTVIPFAPTTRTPISLRTYLHCSAGPATVTVLGGVIKVHFEQSANLCGDPPIVAPNTVRVPGLLAAGEYRVEVTVDPEDAIATTTTFVVRNGEPQPFEVQPSVVRLGWSAPPVLAISAPQSLCASAANCRVFVDGLPATGVTLATGGIILFTAPALDAGFADVRVENGAAFVTVQKALYVASGAAAAEPALFEPVLFPLLLDAPGANGSLWRTEAVVSNPKPWPVYAWEGEVLAPHQVVRLAGGEHGRGFVLRVPRDQAPYVSFGLRARDVSRVEEGYGTEIPAVRERDLFFDTPLTMLDVPVERGYRVKVRVYALAAVNRSVAISVFPRSGPNITTYVPLIPVCNVSGCHSYAELDVPADGEDAARADVTVDLPDAPVWGFVTVTNNETQQVTVVTPGGKGGRG
jgi:hypothetical protein